MSADQFGILLDYIKIAARAGADLPDASLVELPNGQIAPFDGGYASEEELRVQWEAFNAAHPDFDFLMKLLMMKPQCLDRRRVLRTGASEGRH